jgi:hypothetical protein
MYRHLGHIVNTNVDMSCIHTYIHTYMNEYLQAIGAFFKHKCRYVDVYTHTCNMYMHIFMHAIYIYIYIHVYVHIHIVYSGP